MRIMQLLTDCELRSQTGRSNGAKRGKAKERSGGRFREKLRCFSFGTRVGVASA